MLRTAMKMLKELVVGKHIRNYKLARKNEGFEILTKDYMVMLIQERKTCLRKLCGREISAYHNC